MMERGRGTWGLEGRRRERWCRRVPAPGEVLVSQQQRNSLYLRAGRGFLACTSLSLARIPARDQAMVEQPGADAGRVRADAAAPPSGTALRQESGRVTPVHCFISTIMDSFQSRLDSLSHNLKPESSAHSDHFHLQHTLALHPPLVILPLKHRDPSGRFLLLARVQQDLASGEDVL